jgi:hypothetical protein
MKTLVIHPDDYSTDFLKSIYVNLNATVLTTCTKEQVNEEISKHDRIMMMGHGSPFGLFSINRFTSDNGFVIDYSTVKLLRNKENVFIWCNADQFVKNHKLNGLYSGMFISEVGEANYCGLPGIAQEVVDESNNTFAKLLGSVISGSLYEAYQYTKYYYDQLAEVNAVAEYNAERFYLAE